MSRRSVQALLLAIALATFLGWLHHLGTRLLWIWLLGTVSGLLVWGIPWFGARHLGDLRDWLRGRLWATEEGSLHSFCGVILRVEHDGRHVWVGARGLMRATGRNEPEDVLAARHAGHWMRGADGALLLRMDAVTRNLASQPGRENPRIQKLRRYLERDILFPASQRRARAR